MFRTLKSGRKVYGGGGITPDIIVAVDTTVSTKCMRQMIASGATGDYLLSYVVLHRDSLLGLYPALDDYDAAFSLSDDDLADLVHLAKERGTEIDDDEYEASKETLAIYVKALVAERIYPHGAFYYIFNRRRDNVYAEAVAIIDGWKQAYRTILQAK